MQINIIDRGPAGSLYQVISVQFSYEEEEKREGLAANRKARDSNLKTDIMLVSGREYQQQFRISTMWSETVKNDAISISAAAIFMLPAKYQTLTKMVFKYQREGEDQR